jgi:hypothetical protein
MAERLESFARRQLDDIEPLLTSMVAEVSEHLLMDSEPAGELRDEVVESLRRIATTTLEIVADGGSLDDLGPLIEQTARRRRAQGVPLWQVLKTYEVAQQALLDIFSRQLRGHPREASIFPQLTRRLLEFQRVTTTWVSVGFSSLVEERGRDRFADVQALLEVRTGRREPVGDDRDLGRRLGLTQSLQEVTVSTALGPGVDDAGRTTARANPWGIVGVLDGRIVGLTLRAAQGFPRPCGTARLPDGAGPVTVQATITAAGQAADVAAALGTEQFSVAEAGPLAVLLDLPEPERARYVESCFGALAVTARGRSLLVSVSAALTYGRPGEAARVLQVHRHTLDYRLTRFSAETGLDLSDPATRFRCSIGLFLIGLMPHRPEA